MYFRNDTSIFKGIFIWMLNCLVSLSVTQTIFPFPSWSSSFGVWFYPSGGRSIVIAISWNGP